MFHKVVCPSLHLPTFKGSSGIFRDFEANMIKDLDRRLTKVRIDPQYLFKLLKALLQISLFFRVSHYISPNQDVPQISSKTQVDIFSEKIESDFSPFPKAWTRRWSLPTSRWCSRSLSAHETPPRRSRGSATKGRGQIRETDPKNTTDFGPPRFW